MPENLSKLRCRTLDGGAILELTLAAPKGNVLDRVLTAELTECFAELREEPAVKAVLLGADGPHFSFGASVAEHQADQVEAMLHGFHHLFETMARTAVPVVAAVRGQCLGGGLELASYCHRLVASPDAKLGQPEIRLGVFAPVASVVLPERVGRGVAEDLLLSGRSMDAPEALAVGLVDEIQPDPDSAALDWIRRHLLPHSASSLRMAVRAARSRFDRDFPSRIAELTRLYLDELMKTRDAAEGIDAFLARRPPEWSDR